MRTHLLWLLGVAFILTGCGGSRKASEVKVSPAWVQARPATSTYYVGIGSARKTVDPNGYMQTAKQNALADMASDISINISSNSVLSAFETQQRFYEDYTSTIKAQAQKELEGYEVVDTWEDEFNYWVYYRLSKEQYRVLVEAKKRDAAAKSLDFYGKATQSIDMGDIRGGLTLLVKALEPLKPYLAESMIVSHNGHDIFLGNEIIQRLSQTVSSLSVVGPQRVPVKLGRGISPSELQFTVYDKNRLPQKGIALKANYSERTLLPYKTVTDAMGVAPFGIDAVRSSKPAEKLTMYIDIEPLVYEATTDFTLRKLLSKMSTPFTEVEIIVEKPVFYLTSSEVNVGKPLAERCLLEAAKRKLIESGMLITEKPSSADYSINIQAATIQSAQVGEYQQVALSATLSVKNSSGIELYRRSLDRIQGRHFDVTMAGKNAFNDAVKRLESTMMREVIEVVVKGKSSY